LRQEWWVGEAAREPRVRYLPHLETTAGHRPEWAATADAAAGAATGLKLVVNSWVLSVVEAGAEAIALAEGSAWRKGPSSTATRT
jgi:hypothetical protein